MVVLYLLMSEVLLLVVLVVVDCSWLGWLNLCCHWLRAHAGNWQCWSAVLIWCNSLSILSWVEDTVLALCAKVLKTLCFAVMWWLLSQWRYWSVCVGFL